MAQNDLDDIAYNKFANGEITLVEYIKYINSDKIMKNYEEKYNAALERAEILIEKLESNHIKGFIYHIFPELKESEDEKIKKWIIDDIRYNMNNEPLNNSEYKKKAEKAIAWIEQQCERSWKPTKEQFEALDYAYNSCSDTERGNYYEGVLADLIEDLHKLQEKQTHSTLGQSEVTKTSDQELSDKVEPKFKVGQWIVNNKSNDVFLIKSFNNGYCTLEDIKGNIFSPCELPFEDDYNIWTIEDAKDGDVVITNINTQYEWLGLFKEKTGETFSTHCHYSHYTDKLVITPARCKNHGCGKYSDIQPATKEQRDLLFQKMEKAGYEWDAENKCLTEK